MALTNACQYALNNRKAVTDCCVHNVNEIRLCEQVCDNRDRTLATHLDLVANCCCCLAQSMNGLLSAEKRLQIWGYCSLEQAEACQGLILKM